MAAKQVRYYDYRQIKTVECRCGWSGPPGPCEDYFDALLDVTCPRCDTMLLIVLYPTDEETRKAAAAGNEEALAELQRLEKKSPE